MSDNTELKKYTVKQEIIAIDGVKYIAGVVRDSSDKIVGYVIDYNGSPATISTKNIANNFPKGRYVTNEKEITKVSSPISQGKVGSKEQNKTIAEASQKGSEKAKGGKIAEASQKGSEKTKGGKIAEVSQKGSEKTKGEKIAEVIKTVPQQKARDAENKVLDEKTKKFLKEKGIDSEKVSDTVKRHDTVKRPDTNITTIKRDITRDVEQGITTLLGEEGAQSRTVGKLSEELRKYFNDIPVGELPSGTTSKQLASKLKEIEDIIKELEKTNHPIFVAANKYGIEHMANALADTVVSTPQEKKAVVNSIMEVAKDKGLEDLAKELTASYEGKTITEKIDKGKAIAITEGNTQYFEKLLKYKKSLLAVAASVMAVLGYKVLKRPKSGEEKKEDIFQKKGINIGAGGGDTGGQKPSGGSGGVGYGNLMNDIKKYFNTAYKGIDNLIEDISKIRIHEDSIIKEYAERRNQIMQSMPVVGLAKALKGMVSEREIEAVMLNAAYKLPPDVYNQHIGNIVAGYTVAKERGIPVNAGDPMQLSKLAEVGEKVASSDSMYDLAIKLPMQYIGEVYNSEVIPRIESLRKLQDVKTNIEQVKGHLVGSIIRALESITSTSISASATIKASEMRLKDRNINLLE